MQQQQQQHSRLQNWDSSGSDTKAVTTRKLEFLSCDVGLPSADRSRRWGEEKEDDLKQVEGARTHNPQRGLDVVNALKNDARLRIMVSRLQVRLPSSNVRLSYFKSAF